MDEVYIVFYEDETIEDCDGQRQILGVFKSLPGAQGFCFGRVPVYDDGAYFTPSVDKTEWVHGGYDEAHPQEVLVIEQYRMEA